MSEKTFFLTFDGAPHPPQTDNVLAKLEKHAIKATFFMEGHRLESEGECGRRVLAAGHEVGNHSYSHPEFNTIPIEQCREEIQRTDNIIFDQLGIRPRYMRPPAGKLTPEVAEAILSMGYVAALWSYSIRDWTGPDADAIADRLLSQLEDGAIVVFHDRIQWVPQTLDIIIPQIKEAGYVFRRISEYGSEGIIPHNRK